MNVLHVNTHAYEGGAGRAAYRLHTALRRSGEESRIVSADYVKGRDDLQTWVPKTPLWWLLHHATWWLEIQTGLEGALNVTSWFGYRRHAEWADVVNLHNIHGYYFSLLLLPRIERLAPLVWTLHDMWPLTGHCAYPMDCSGWLSGCGNCPNLAGPPKVKRDVSRLLYSIRRRVYSRCSPVLVTPSRWLRRQVRRAPLTQHFRATCIPNGLDTDVFLPTNKRAAREALGLPSDERLAFFSAHVLGARRKGGDLLMAALRLLRESGLDNVRLLVAGGGGEEIEREAPYPVFNVGRVEGEALMAVVYSAADVFVLPTRADNLPNVLLEALSCGTPCVAFRVGGVPEVVRPGETGWLAEPEDPEDLALNLHEALTDDAARERMSEVCRSVAEKEYNVELMRRRYVRLYEEVIEERLSRGGH